MPYSPPFELTHTMIRLIAQISQQVCERMATKKDKLVHNLRKENRMLTISGFYCRRTEYIVVNANHGFD